MDREKKKATPPETVTTWTVTLRPSRQADGSQGPAAAVIRTNGPGSANVDGRGTLLIMQGSRLMGAFSAGSWQRVDRQEEPAPPPG